jgi:uncharacterized protein YdaU (DUF1376 family)
MSYIERGLYRELLDECWVEGYIPNDVELLADICGCPEEVMASAWQVLSNCFVDIGDGNLVNEKLHSLRTAKDVERLKKSENGKLGALAKASAKQVLSKCHIEEKRREEKRKEDIHPPDGVSVSVWNDFLKLRKAKRLPMTDTAWQGIVREANKANMTVPDVIVLCCERGWASFKADWAIDNKPKQNAVWWNTEQSILNKGRELGINPRAGESMGEFKGRIQSALERL